jgi:hypothetical protein
MPLGCPLGLLVGCIDGKLEGGELTELTPHRKSIMSAIRNHIAPAGETQ